MDAGSGSTSGNSIVPGHLVGRFDLLQKGELS